MILALAVFLNYCLQYCWPNSKYWQAKYAQYGKHLYIWLLQYAQKQQSKNLFQKVNTPIWELLLSGIPYFIYLCLAIFLQISSDSESNFNLGFLIGLMIFLVLGVIHIQIPEVGPQKEGKNIDISPHYFKEIYLKTMLPLCFILLPYGYILLALYFNIHFLLYQNIIHLPIEFEDFIEKINEWLEEKMQLISAVIFAIMSHQEDVWQAIRWRHTKHPDFLYQILYHASPMVTQIDFEATHKSHIYKNTTLILKRSLWAFAILFIVRGFFS